MPYIVELIFFNFIKKIYISTTLNLKYNGIIYLITNLYKYFFDKIFKTLIFYQLQLHLKKLIQLILNK